MSEKYWFCRGYQWFLWKIFIFWKNNNFFVQLLAQKSQLSENCVKFTPLSACKTRILGVCLEKSKFLTRKKYEQNKYLWFFHRFSWKYYGNQWISAKSIQISENVKFIDFMIFFMKISSSTHSNYIVQPPKTAGAGGVWQIYRVPLICPTSTQ